MWHRKFIALKYTTERKVSALRRTQQEIRQLVVRIATENPRWGYSRIVGTLQNLGIKRSRTTIANILRDEGIPPEPRRDNNLDWSAFVKTHLDVLSATDFFTTEVWTWRGLVRYHVHFIIDVATRKVRVTNISCQWTGETMLNVFRGLLDCVDEALLKKRYLIMDRDSLYSEAVRQFLKDAGVKVIRLPHCAPKMNIYAERFVKSIKYECLNHLVLIGENSLHKAVNEYVAHYNHERNHQGIGNQIIERLDEAPELLDSQTSINQELIEKTGRLGGMLNYYHRKAA